MDVSIHSIQPAWCHFYSLVFERGRHIDVSSRRTHDKRRISWNITAPGRYEWIEHRTTFLQNKYFGDFYDYYDRFYLQSRGPRHDGNTVHCRASLRCEKAA